MRKIIIAAALAGFACIAIPGSATADAVVVGTDDAGDWGSTIDPEISPVGSALGQDLVSASILVDGDTVNFVIGVTELPESGGVPEGTRYTWNMNVNDVELELDGKFTNYSRGTCDPTAGTCPPPRDPGPQPFVLRGLCADHPTLPLHTCTEFAKVQAVFDPASDTITVPVPHDALTTSNCAEIRAGIGHFGGFVSAFPSAFVSHDAGPHDLLEDNDLVIVNTCD